MQKIKIESVIAADINKVWKCWNDTESIKVWAHASDDWCCPYAENDLREGGRFLTRMSAVDGSASFDFTGSYAEVIENSKIWYKMDIGIDDNADDSVQRECIVTFEDIGEGKTRVVEEFTPEAENPIEMQRAGWQAILDNFKRHVESV